MFAPRTRVTRIILTNQVELYIVNFIMKVILAGFNIDSEVIKALAGKCPERNDITPETLSASYARISRDPRSVDQLREIARRQVERARKSNRSIIFKMGHHSVAEHAVFNFDIIGVSRLAIEDIEHFRLCSFTEKSQRYIKLGDDYVIPDEIKQAGMTGMFKETIQDQFAVYEQLYRKLRPYFFEKYRGMSDNSKKHSILDGWAKEDARYVVSLATQGQLGMTLNARNLEFMIRRFASSSKSEILDLNRRMYAAAKETAPSVILFTEPNDFDSLTYKELKPAAQAVSPAASNDSIQPVTLVEHTAEGDSRLAAALLHSVSSHSYKDGSAHIQHMNSTQIENLIKTAVRHMQFYDSPIREFEFPDFVFELVVSASCYAQLKRHRMATLTVQAYNPELGVTIPPSVKEIKEETLFLDLMERTNRAYEKIREKTAVGGDYILTNAHRRRVLLKLNARELYHVTRLREDGTAQWEIRQIAGEMNRFAREKMPLTCLLLGGKDDFPRIYEEVFGHPPAVLPPE
jgi:flavin-dependent thymidylate synthase